MGPPKWRVEEVGGGLTGRGIGPNKTLGEMQVNCAASAGNDHIRAFFYEFGRTTRAGKASSSSYDGATAAERR
ncbi:hypothetical protein MTO96_002552 [Rhipicephalus appendiculatus]